MVFQSDTAAPHIIRNRLDKLAISRVAFRNMFDPPLAPTAIRNVENGLVSFRRVLMIEDKLAELEAAQARRHRTPRPRLGKDSAWGRIEVRAVPSFLSFDPDTVSHLPVGTEFWCRGLRNWAIVGADVWQRFERATKEQVPASYSDKDRIDLLRLLGEPWFALPMDRFRPVSRPNYEVPAANLEAMMPAAVWKTTRRDPRLRFFLDTHD